MKALHATKTSPFVQQYHKVLNDINTWHIVGLNGAPGHAGIQGNEIADRLARDGSFQKFVGSESSFQSLGRT